MAIYYADGSNSNQGRQVQLVSGTSSAYTLITSTTYSDVTGHYLDITPKENANTLMGTYTMYLKFYFLCQ